MRSHVAVTPGNIVMVLINFRVVAQGLDIPDDLKALYKTVWELKQRTLVDMAADRGAFIDQSQSFNVHMSDPNFGKLTSLHFYAWKVCTCFETQHFLKYNALNLLPCFVPLSIWLHNLNVSLIHRCFAHVGRLEDRDVLLAHTCCC